MKQLHFEMFIYLKINDLISEVGADFIRYIFRPPAPKGEGVIKDEKHLG